MDIQELLIWWADQSAALSYRPEQLSVEDAARAAAIRSAKALRDWKASRALLHDVRSRQPDSRLVSLSHSNGHAIVATAPAGWKIGADLEAISPRDVQGLAHWVCSAAERDLLVGLPDEARLLRFYQLWTLKEAFIKAAGLDFPADMASVGLRPAPPGLALNPPPGRWRACSYRVGAAWMASVVWQPSEGSAGDLAQPVWTGAAGCQLPDVLIQGSWQADTT